MIERVGVVVVDQRPIGRREVALVSVVRVERHHGDGLRAALEARERWPLVVEATGRPEVFASALGLVEPRGALVLKTTAERKAEVDLAPIVVDELTVLGSRCGPFEPALAALADGSVRVQPMIDARYPLEEGVRALEHAGRPGTLKVLIDVSSPS